MSDESQSDRDSTNSAKIVSKSKAIQQLQNPMIKNTDSKLVTGLKNLILKTQEKNNMTLSKKAAD